MSKWVCSVCGYVYEGDAAPAECPVCHVSGVKDFGKCRQKKRDESRQQERG